MVFLLTIAVIAIYFNLSKPRIVILHSYHPDYAWTRDVNIGIQRVAANWSHYQVQWHYMDTKKHHDQRWQQQASLLARRVIDTTEPDVLIIIDDLAQQLVGKHYVNHPHIELVFAGVNGSVKAYGYLEADNVTGIFERKQLRAIQETLLALEHSREQPRHKPRVLYLIDNSPSLQQGLPYFQRFNWQGLDYLGALQVDHFAQWQAIVSQAQRYADYLLVANYRKLSRSATDTSTPPAHEVMQWTEAHSPIPVIGVNLFNTEEGAMLSIGVSPYEQGETVARLAEEIISQHRSAGDIPMQDNKHYVVALNQAALQRRGIVMPSIYEAFGRATANYYD